MRRIPLTKGQFALVDDEDFERFGGLKWQAKKMTGMRTYYAARYVPRKDSPTGRQQLRYLHREIAACPSGYVVDHANHDTLDCRRSNLRVCKSAENIRNRAGLNVNNRSGFRGVSWDRSRRRWQAVIKVDRRRIFLGRFPEKKAAADAYSAANKKYFGAFGGALR